MPWKIIKRNPQKLIEWWICKKGRNQKFLNCTAKLLITSNMKHREAEILQFFYLLKPRGSFISRPVYFWLNIIYLTKRVVALQRCRIFFPWGVTLGENRKIRLSNQQLYRRWTRSYASFNASLPAPRVVVQWMRHVRVVVIYCTPARFSKG